MTDVDQNPVTRWNAELTVEEERLSRLYEAGADNDLTACRKAIHHYRNLLQAALYLAAVGKSDGLDGTVPGDDAG